LEKNQHRAQTKGLEKNQQGAVEDRQTAMMLAACVVMAWMTTNMSGDPAWRRHG
jgi:hypothetical protein